MHERLSSRDLGQIALQEAPLHEPCAAVAVIEA
jgi:hypothetical protein